IEYVEKIPIADTTKKIAMDTKEENVSYTIQVGAFYNPDYFARFKEKAKANLGKEVYHVFVNELYKIRFGKFDSKSEAEKYLEFAKSIGFGDAFLIPTKK
ncbi:MAG: SPOR domain-containing protein, partial [Ignavibacteria bacterium]